MGSIRLFKQQPLSGLPQLVVTDRRAHPISLARLALIPPRVLAVTPVRAFCHFFHRSSAWSVLAWNSLWDLGNTSGSRKKRLLQKIVTQASVYAFPGHVGAQMAVWYYPGDTDSLWLMGVWISIRWEPRCKSGWIFWFRAGTCLSKVCRRYHSQEDIIWFRNSRQTFTCCHSLSLG